MNLITHLDPFGPTGNTYPFTTTGNSGSFTFRLLGSDVGNYNAELRFVFKPKSLVVESNWVQNSNARIYAFNGSIANQKPGALTVPDGYWPSSVSFGSWIRPDGKSHYVAFQSNPDNDGSDIAVYDAWMRLQWNRDTTLTIYDWAYTTQPGEPVRVGAVPEPSSSVILAIFAAFVIFSRIRQSAIEILAPRRASQKRTSHWA